MAAETPGGRSTWPAWVLVWALALVARAIVLLVPDERLVQIASDDAFYYIVGARHLRLDGPWPTMDGVHETSGFHPLYMLVVTALDALAAGAGGGIVRALTATNLALGIAAAALAAAIARTGARAHASAGWLAAAVTLMSPTWLGHGLLGVENMLAALAIGIWMWRVLRRLSSSSPDPGAWPLRALVIDGLCVGLAGLARTDAALAAAGVALALVAVTPGGHRRRAIARLALVALVALAVVLPWLILLLSVQGSILQDSARALLARTAAESPTAATLVATIGKHLMFWVYRLTHVPFGLATGALLLGLVLGLARRGIHGENRAAGPSLPPVQAAHAPADRPRPVLSPFVVALGIALLLDGLGAFLRANSMWNIRDHVQLGAELAVVLAVLATGFRLAWRVGPSSDLSGGMRWWLVLLAPIPPLVVYYAVVFRHFQLWYASVASFLLLAAAARVVSALTPRGARGVVVAALAVVMLAGTARVVMLGTYRPFAASPLADPALRERVARALPERPGRPVLGSFDSGQLSYRLWPYPVTNLDGVMNHAAASALDTGRFSDYLARSGPEYATGDSARIAHFAAIGAFDVEPAPALSRAIGLAIYRLVPRTRR